MADHSLLKKISIFEGMSDEELKRIAAIFREKDVIAGDPLFDEGAKATAFFILRSGTVEILKKGAQGEDQRVAAFSAGSHFGEMAFLDGSARTASAMARENSSLFEVPYEALGQLLEKDHEIGFKLYRTLARSLARRIRQTTTDLSTLRDLKLRHQ